jgi:hypothetical protein
MVMGLLAGAVGILLLVTACTTDPAAQAGPRLVREVTLAPTVLFPTPFVSPTRAVLPVITAAPVSPVAVSTIEGRFPQYVLVTATLPPSKTPTLTPTITRTSSPTPAASPTLFPSPIPTIGAVVLPVYPAGSQPCHENWFFSTVITASCPLGPAQISLAAYQQFQQGFMLWVERQDSIYIFFESGGWPRWQVFRDTFQEGMPEEDPALNASAPPSTWQPRRGFGIIWRENSSVRDRIGWAVMEREVPFTTQVQIGLDGSVFLAESSGGIIGLQPGGQSWNRYNN